MTDSVTRARFPKGMIVGANNECLKQWPRLANKTATVVGYGTYAEMVRLVWDGTKTASTWHSSFVYPISQPIE